MPYLLIPKQSGTTQATVWLAAVDESVDGSAIFLDYGSHRLDVSGGWSVVNGSVQICHRRVDLGPLEPGRRYALSLLIGGRVVASGETVTFPETLPTAGRKPFTVLLGSCFWHERDPGLSSAFTNLPEKPDMKILCGDQVYLDAPASHFSLHTHSRAELEASFASAYLSSFGRGGLADVLRAGANYFSSDDHELWNNAPSRATLVRDTWRTEGRRNWLEAARQLYGLFQSDEAVTRFAVGSLSFCIADTRMDRDADEKRFMLPEHLAQVRAWIGELNGPGVLVVGQPLFAKGAGLLGHLFDWGLPDYKQFSDLVRTLMASRHDIVVLTGDVHYARAARCRLPSGRDLIEIISSPLALVDERVGRKWKKAPEKFPAVPVGGVTASDIHHFPSSAEPLAEPFQEHREHFVLLHFSADGAKVRLAASCVPFGSGKPASRKMCNVELM